MSMILYLARVSDIEIEQWKAHSDLTDKRTEEILEGNATFDVGKAWHGIHYLLTGTVGDGAEPFCYLMKGGAEVGEDMGYGPARVLDSGQVTIWSQALQGITNPMLRDRYDAAKMDEEKVYPPIWTSDPLESMDWLVGAFAKLRDYVVASAAAGSGIVVLLT